LRYPKGQNEIYPASGHTARDGAVSKPSRGRMSIKAAKSGEYTLWNRYSADFPAIFLKHSVN
jgi:hypothetical protein